LRSWGQKNPLIEYKKEAFAMFQDMMRQIRGDVVYHVFHLNMERFDAHQLEKKREQELEEINFGSNEIDAPTSSTQQAHSDKIGRNESCACGSGKKYKKCCGK
jgi:preprotein translocase subunit SecA